MLCYGMAEGFLSPFIAAAACLQGSKIKLLLDGGQLT